MKKPLLFLLLCVSLFSLFGHNARAEEPKEETPEKTLENALPEEFRELFLKDGKPELPDLTRFLGACFASLKDQLKKSGADLSLFLSCVLLCSVLSLLQKTLCARHGGPLSLCLTIAGCASAFGSFAGLLKIAQTHVSQICRFMSAIVPAITGAAAASGGVSSAAVSSAAFSMILAFHESFTLGALLPLQKVFFAFDLTSAVTGQKAPGAFAKSLRGLFLFLLGLSSAVLSTVFAFQNIVAAKADSVALRAFRFTAGSAVPLVGNVFSETSKTLMAGFGYLRGAIGAVGVFVLLLFFLPVFLLLLLSRAVYQISSALADALDAEPLSRIFKSGASFAGALCALSAISDLSCIVALSAAMYTAL